MKTRLESSKKTKKKKQKKTPSISILAYIIAFAQHMNLMSDAHRANFEHVPLVCSQQQGHSLRSIQSMRVVDQHACVVGAHG